MNIILATPRGFCAGVDSAIAIVERALDVLGAPVYVRHEVVHNRYVVDKLKQCGAVFVDELSAIPDAATVIFSAHGVSQEVRQEAKRRALKVFDATCPLVTKVHLQVIHQCRSGRDMILIGHAGHPEVEGTMGQWDKHLLNAGNMYLIETLADVAQLQLSQPKNCAYTTQTTLSVDDTKAIIDALKEKFPEIVAPRSDDICYATQNRQNAVRQLAQQCDLVLVVGSSTSSNSSRLRELAERSGVRAYLIENASKINPKWIVGCKNIGITAGASAPEILVQGVIQRLYTIGAKKLYELEGVKENINFSLPRELRVQLVN